MKTKKLNAAALTKGAKVENKVINTNPGYIFRTLNKRAQGRDKDAREIEGYSRENIKELYSRLDSTFAAGGFWWSSIYAVNGRPVVSISAVNDSTAYYLDPAYNLGADHVLIHFAGGYYVGRLGQWSENAVLDAAKVRLQLVEKYVAALNSQEAQERKAQERKERKEERKAENKRKAQERKEQKEQAKELAKVVQELKEQIACGAVSQEQAAAKVQELFTA